MWDTTPRRGMWWRRPTLALTIRSGMGARAKLWMVLLLGPGCFLRQASHVQVGGMPPVPITQSSVEEVRVLTLQAAQDLGCPSVTFTHHTSTIRATGCSKHAIYVEVLHGERGEDPLVVTFVNIATASSTDPAIEGDARLLVQIDERAASDLSCPRSEIVPELVSYNRRGTTYEPVATGCGHRATYLPVHDRGERPTLHLASRLDVDDVASDFEPWHGASSPSR